MTRHSRVYDFTMQIHSASLGIQKATRLIQLALLLFLLVETSAMHRIISKKEFWRYKTLWDVTHVCRVCEAVKAKDQWWNKNTRMVWYGFAESKKCVNGKNHTQVILNQKNTKQTIYKFKKWVDATKDNFIECKGEGCNAYFGKWEDVDVCYWYEFIGLGHKDRTHRCIQVYDNTCPDETMGGMHSYDGSPAKMETPPVPYAARTRQRSLTGVSSRCRSDTGGRCRSDTGGRSRSDTSVSSRRRSNSVATRRSGSRRISTTMFNILKKMEVQLKEAHIYLDDLEHYKKMYGSSTMSCSTKDIQVVEDEDGLKPIRGLVTRDELDLLYSAIVGIPTKEYTRLRQQCIQVVT